MSASLEMLIFTAILLPAKQISSTVIPHSIIGVNNTA